MDTHGITGIDGLDLAGKKVLVRVDFNVPLKNGAITDDTRIQASIPTIRQLLDERAQVILMTHLGRPTEGQYDSQFSLAPVAKRLAELLGTEVPLVNDWALPGQDLPTAPIIMLENVRFVIGEKANDDQLARRMADLCDVYVNDAFATAHRAQASTHGVAKFAAQSCAGPLMLSEVDALTRALAHPAKPMVAIVGGAKVSTKLTLLSSLLEVVDQLIVGGGIANTFLAAAGVETGKSLLEPDLVDVAKQLLATAQASGKEIPLPVDVVCGKQFDENTPATTRQLQDIQADDMILDVGPKTAQQYAGLVGTARTIVWNGPLGVFEFEQFSNGTRVLATAIADSEAFSIAGGGDTLAAIARFGISDQISYISTAGGAFLEFLEGKELPAVAILRNR